MQGDRYPGEGYRGHVAIKSFKFPNNALLKGVRESRVFAWAVKVGGARGAVDTGAHRPQGQTRGSGGRAAGAIPGRGGDR